MLTTFRCSTGRWFQDDVEQFINGKSEQKLLIPERHVLLFTHDTQAVAVAAHQQGRLLMTDGTDVRDVRAAHLMVVAIAEPLHGAVLPEGGRLSDHVMQELLVDAQRTHRTEMVFAIVALDNQRSLTLCERNGLTSQTALGNSAVFARVTGRFALEPES